MTDRDASSCLGTSTGQTRVVSNRRDFLRAAGLGAVGLALAARPALAEAAPSQAYLDRMAAADACKAKGDFAGMAAAIREALKVGEGNEYAWRSLAWSLGRAGEFRESLTIARENLRRHGVCAWTLAQLGDSALCMHDAKLSHWALSRALRLRPQPTGGAAGALRDLHRRRLGMFAAKRISVTWTIEVSKTWLKTADNVVWLRLPQLRHPRQDIRFELLAGATGGRLVRSEDVDYLRVRYNPEQAIVIRTEALVRPDTYPIEVLERTKVAPIPPEIAREFLGKSTDCPIDPTGPRCQKLIAELKGPTAYATIDNIMRWMRDNFTYKENPTQDSEGLLADHFGVCHHYSVVITALARAAGIPARIVGGEVFGWSSEYDRSVVGGGSHGWVEVYLNPLGWVELDGLGYGSFGATQRDLGVYLRFHTVGHVGDPMLPDEFSLQGSPQIEARLLEVIPDRKL